MAAGGDTPSFSGRWLSTVLVVSRTPNICILVSVRPRWVAFKHYSPTPPLFPEKEKHSPSSHRKLSAFKRLNDTIPNHISPSPRSAPADNRIVDDPRTPRPQAGAVLARRYRMVFKRYRAWVCEGEVACVDGGRGGNGGEGVGSAAVEPWHVGSFVECRW